MNMRDKVFNYIHQTYHASPEYLWAKFPDYAVFRQEDNGKWFGIVMSIPASKLGIDSEEEIDILDVKVEDPMLMEMLLKQEGYYPGWHMPKKSWITVVLDGTVPMEEIHALLEESYMSTAPKARKDIMRPTKDWIVPANPKYYDVEAAFASGKEVDWKQGNGIKAGDTVYVYVAAPVSAILYKCKVLETEIPYQYSDEKLTIKALMKLKLMKEYQKEQFTFEKLKEEYGVYAIRGPRGVPNKLKRAL